jgi:tRNA (guanine-N7-)-methyltransferase
MKPEDKRFHGRIIGKPMKGARAAFLDNKLPEVEVKYDEDLTKLKESFSTPVDELWLEIGFGNGEHVISQAISNPKAGIIGAEPYLNGVSALLRDMGDLKNIRILPADIRPLLEYMPDNCLDKVFILFNDPWPKTRHHKRRFANKYNLDRLARVMRPGAELVFATDHKGLAGWSIKEFEKHPSFEWLNRAKISDWRKRPNGWFPTRYEEKALKQGRKSVYFYFKNNKK